MAILQAQRHVIHSYLHICGEWVRSWCPRFASCRGIGESGDISFPEARKQRPSVPVEAGSHAVSLTIARNRATRNTDKNPANCEDVGGRVRRVERSQREGEGLWLRAFGCTSGAGEVLNIVHRLPRDASSEHLQTSRVAVVGPRLTEVGGACILRSLCGIWIERQRRRPACDVRGGDEGQ
jgi:hypothetical protein